MILRRILEWYVSVWIRSTSIWIGVLDKQRRIWVSVMIFSGIRLSKTDAKRTNVLCRGTVLGHNENVFAFQYGTCRQTVGLS